MLACSAFIFICRLDKTSQTLFLLGENNVTVLIVHRIVLFGNRIVPSKMADRKTGER